MATLDLIRSPEATVWHRLEAQHPNGWELHIGLCNTGLIRHKEQIGLLSLSHIPLFHQKFLIALKTEFKNLPKNKTKKKHVL